MDDVRIGAGLRTIRRRRRLRQIDVARRAGVSRGTIVRLEQGQLGGVRMRTLRDVANALGVTIDVGIRWRGSGLERVANAGHASLHASLATHLASVSGWTWRPEVSFSIYGERGVIDIVAWHAATRSLLIIELKTSLVDPQELVATTDRRVRLGRRIARERGWDAATVSAWVVLTDTRTNRRRGRQHAGILRVAFPHDGHAMRRWLRRPVGTISALSFWADVAI